MSFQGWGIRATDLYSPLTGCSSLGMLQLLAVLHSDTDAQSCPTVILWERDCHIECVWCFCMSLGTAVGY